MIRLVLLAFAALAAVSCEGCSQQGPCTEDAQCDTTGEGFIGCDVNSGLCVCRSDRACGPNEICNPLGRCQAISGCTTNDDCGEGQQEEEGGLFCDIVTSQCLSVLECNPGPGVTCCSLDDQCPFREICDALTLTCVPGCRDDGDCLLGEGCAGAGFGAIGVCGTACTSDNQCPPQNLCNLGTGICELDTRGPYCQGCPLGSDGECGAFDNYCLVDQVNGGGFCGIDCLRSGDGSCPSAYECVDVVVVLTTHQCTFPEGCTDAGVCSRSGTVCAEDEDCPEGPPYGDCVERTGKTGACQLDPNTECDDDTDCAEGECNQVACVGNEGDNFGFCTCTRDADCFDDRCVAADLSDPANPIVGHCEISGHPCFEDFECNIITCIDGGCRIGKNCVPSSGRTCRDFIDNGVVGE